MLKPEVKDCQWLLQMAEGEHAWDWNADNSASLIDFYKEVIKNDQIDPQTPLPYYYLLDDLIADRRTEEAKEYLEILKRIPAHREFLIPVYEANIALAEFDVEKADSIMARELEIFGKNSGFVFENAQYHARKGEYNRAIELFEKSWSLEEDKKPRYTDALCSIAIIYQILGDKKNAISTYDRILTCLRDEWGFSKDDKPYIEVERDKSKLL
jgi:tetratricopeptide (TPR) repeat protein